MQRMLPQCDCVVEVHDARISFNGSVCDFLSLSLSLSLCLSLSIFLCISLSLSVCLSLSLSLSIRLSVFPFISFFFPSCFSFGLCLTFFSSQLSMLPFSPFFSSFSFLSPSFSSPVCALQTSLTKERTFL